MPLSPRPHAPLLVPMSRPNTTLPTAPRLPTTQLLRLDPTLGMVSHRPSLLSPRGNHLPSP